MLCCTRHSVTPLSLTRSLLSNPVELDQTTTQGPLGTWASVDARPAPAFLDTARQHMVSSLINSHNDQQDEPLPHARLHDLRHVNATTLLLAGVPVHVVAARLSHAAPSITLRVYDHVISDQLTEATDIFGRALAAIYP